MPVYQITYQTQNTYLPPVNEAILEFLVFPASDGDQELISLDINMSPDVKPFFSENIYGFEVARFRLKKEVREFSLVVNATVKKKMVNPFSFVPLSFADERILLNSDDFQIDHYLFLQNSGFTKLPETCEYPVMKEDETVFDFANRVNKFVHELIDYDLKIVDPQRMLGKTVEEKKGVCQDFAHLMLAILRKNRVPARYVSGYLNQGEGTVGGGAVHAWVQALVPGTGWIGFDPTNNVLEDYHYIKIAHGVDIGDCNTLKGVIKGVGSNQTEYQVLVQEQSNEANQ